MWFWVVYMWFGATMAGRHNKNAIKIGLKVLIKLEKGLLSFFVLFHFILYVPINNLSVMSGHVFLG